MKVNWIDIKERTPGVAGDGNEYYVFSYGLVRGDAEWTEYGFDWDSCTVRKQRFHFPNFDQEYGGRFEQEVTHWAVKETPEPPAL